MTHLPCRHHGNFPQRQSNLLPVALEAEPSETGAGPGSTTEEPDVPAGHAAQVCSEGSCSEMDEESLNDRKMEADKRQHGGDVAALLKTISIHPEARRILGNSFIPVVSLERLDFQSLSVLAALQPVVSLERLPGRAQGSTSEDEADVLEMSEASSQCEPAESSGLSQSGSTSWMEPYGPDGSGSLEPEQDSGFDCESDPDQTFILLDDWDQEKKSCSDIFYLDPDPDPEQTVVIELDPEPVADPDQELEDGCEAQCEADEVQFEDQAADLCCLQLQEDTAGEQPGPGAGAPEMESEDFCAVCLNGGDLLCCDRCPKVFHLDCHIPALIGPPLGDWVCTLCRTDQEPVETYDCEMVHACGGVRAPYTLSRQDQRRCEKLTLQLYCHPLSAPFHEPVSHLARNYYQIIKRPMNLSVIRRKLDQSNTLHYFTAEQFLDDVLLMFRNCATFNYPDSEVAQAGRSLEVFFLSGLRETFPERTFPSASQDTTERARQRWLSRRRKEKQRRKRYVFRGKKYYL